MVLIDVKAPFINTIPLFQKVCDLKIYSGAHRFVLFSGSHTFSFGLWSTAVFTSTEGIQSHLCCFKLLKSESFH